MKKFLGQVFGGVAAFLCLFSSSLQAFQEEGGGESAQEQEIEVDSKDDKWFAVTGADVYTGTGAVLRSATVLAKNGVIKKVGYELEYPEGTEVLDAKGYRVYPGLVAISSFGLFGATSDLENSFDPFNQQLVLGLASGLTSAVQGNEAGKLKKGDVEGVVLSKRVFVSESFSSNSPSGKRTVREKLEATAAYLRKYRQWEEDVKTNKELKEPSKKGIDSNYLAVLRGEVRLKFSADDQADLIELANLALQYNFRPVIDGCGEGWTCADLLGRAGAIAIVTPRYRRSKEESLVRSGGSSIENAAILHRSGVQVCVVPSSRGVDLGGIAGRDIMHLPIEAGFAVRGGLPEDAALQAITIVPARLMGVDHRIGTIEVGKDCDLIVTDGDILHYQTFVQWAIVDGKMVYDKQDELFFAHIRPRPESSIAPIKKIDAGETEPAGEETPVEEKTEEPKPEEKEDDGSGG